MPMRKRIHQNHDSFLKAERERKKREAAEKKRREQLRKTAEARARRQGS